MSKQSPSAKADKKPADQARGGGDGGDPAPGTVVDKAVIDQDDPHVKAWLAKMIGGAVRVLATKDGKTKAVDRKLAALDRAVAKDTADAWANAEMDVAAAKVVAGEAAEIVYDDVHQTHGAIGFTYEHELHFTTRRLWAWRGEFGAETEWAEEIGRRVLARGAENLWPDLTVRQMG